MAKERPQLSHDELHGLRWLLGGVLALVAIWSAAFLEVHAWALIGLATAGIVAVLFRPAWPARFSPWVHRLAFPAVVTFFVVDYYTFGELLPAFVRLGILLVGYRACTHRQRRDDLQLILVSLLLVVTTGVLTVSIAFAGQIVVTAGLALALLLTRTLIDAGGVDQIPTASISRAPAWTQVSARALLRRLWRVADWRVGIAAVILFAALVMFSGTLFLAIPRYQLENSLFLDRWMTKKSITGFSDTLRFGDVSDIEKDDSVAMRVEVSDPSRLPAELYWRMIVLDEYHDRAFRLSTAERESAFGRALTQTRVGSIGLPFQAPSLSWTFYLEPGVSRYLPLTGGFLQLTFTEPQSYRASDRLRLVMLARDPATMKAYRVDKMDTTGTFQTHRASGLAARMHAPATTVGMPFPEDQQERWRGLVKQIDPQGTMTAEQFSGAATRWLHAHHTYSLRSVIPAGSEEPLLRWVLSGQPGHCELFAGAFTMLARSEGFPCRVVAGFLGGEWNGDYLIVKNSHAHAWCEILDGIGNWVRVDPTAAASEGGTKVDAVSDFGGRAQTAHGFGAQWDRMRMLWYRHIVNFDQRDQVDLVKSLQGKTDTSVKEARAWIEALRDFIRRVSQGPWDWARWREMAEGATVMGLMAWLIYRLTHAVSRSRWAWQRRKADPIRAEAARWLAKLAKREARDPLALAAVEADLLRIRFGRRETWPDIAATFREARRAMKMKRVAR